MPSDKHNLRMARARDLISSIINVASLRDVPVYQPQQLQCLHHGATFVPLWSPVLSSQPCKVTIWGRHVKASVRDRKIAEALLTLCLTYYVMKRVIAFTHWDMGRSFHEYILHIKKKNKKKNKKSRDHGSAILTSVTNLLPYYHITP